MSDFHVGQEVVCVDGDWRNRYAKGRGRSNEYSLSRGVRWPTTGQHYTIREIVDDEGLPGIRVVELINPTLQYMWDDGVIRPWEAAFAPDRFRPIKSETIEAFREMCRAVSKRINA